MGFNPLRSIANRVNGFTEDTPEKIAAAMARDYTGVPISFSPDETVYGPLAQALAFGAPMAAMQGIPWNSLVDTGDMSEKDCRNALFHTWDVKTEDYWVEVLNMLLGSVYGEAGIYWAVRARTRAARRLGLPVVDDATWAGEIAAVFTERQDPELIGAVQSAIPAVHQTENGLRKARLLGADEQLEGFDAYDLTRAIAVARWGRRIGWGSEHVLPNVAVAVGEEAAGSYTSWRQYGLGFIAGRMATYPDTYGTQLVQAIEALRPLLDSAASPWSNLPFPGVDVFRGPEDSASPR